MTAPARHPHPAELERDPPAPEVAAHVAGCAACRVERRLLLAGPPAGAGPAPRGLFEAARAAAEGRSASPLPCEQPAPEPGPTGPQVDEVPRYVREERLGVGSSAEVYRAFDPALNRHVALKVLHRPGPRAWARFLAEAQVTAQLDHPNVVPIHHLGLTEDGRPYVAEREIRGVSLAEAIRTGRLPTLERRVEALRRVCAAVAHAHSRGVLHRDLKPENVMIGELGEVQVVDWGLSLRLGATPSSEGSATEREGRIAGTPAWMAPEQARGELRRQDARTDVYALGALLFFLIVERPPVREADAVSVMEAVAAGRVLHPRQVDPRAPRELDAVVRRAMATDPADRYPDVHTFLEDLDAWIERRPLPHVGSPLPERLEKLAAHHRATLRAIGATVMAALAVLAFGGWRYAADLAAARDAVAAEAGRARVAAREATLREADARVALADAARLDGRVRDAAAALEQAAVALDAAGGDPRNAAWARAALVAASPPPVSTCAATGRPLQAVAVAPDGTAAAAVDDQGNVAVWDPAGCGPLGAATVGGPSPQATVAWLADGPAVVARVGDQLVHVRPGAGVVARAPLPEGWTGRGRADGSELILHPWGEGALAAGDGRWWTFRFGDPALRPEVPFPAPARGIALVQGGRGVFAHVGAGHLEARGLFDRSTLALQRRYWHAGSATSDGRRALVNARDGAIGVDLATGETLWTTPETPYGEVGVAPGDRVAWHELGGTTHLYELATGAVIGQVVAPATDGLVAVSRDARLLLTAGPDGRVSSWLRSPPPLRRLAEEVPAERGPRLAASPDGRLLAAAGLRGAPEIEVIDLATGVTLRRLAAGDAVNELAWSPDGGRLVAATIAAGIAAWDVASGVEAWRRPLPPAEVPVEWLDDEVLYVDAAGELVVLGGDDGVERRRWPLLRGDSVDLVAVPGSRRVVVGSYLPEAPTAALVDVDTGAVVHRLDAPENRAQIGVSPDGKRAVLAGWNGRSAVWDLETGQVVHTLEAESGPTIGAAFSSDGEAIVTSSWDEQLVFWDATTGARLRAISLGREGGFVVVVPGSLLVNTWSWKVQAIPLDAHTRHEAAVAALVGDSLARARAFAALGWWERVIPELDRGADDPALRAQAWLAAGRRDAAANAARALPDGAWRRVLVTISDAL